jgi:hypothetical protein
MQLRVGLAGLGALVLAMFFDVLFVPGPRVLGIENTDLGLHFLHWRRFGFGELAGGNLALWNPHIYAGVPFFGGMQSALLYPPNGLFLALPLPLAANLSIALNVWPPRSCRRWARRDSTRAARSSSSASRGRPRSRAESPAVQESCAKGAISWRSRRSSSGRRCCS